MGGCEEGTALQHQALSRTNSYCPSIGVCKCPAALCDCTDESTATFHLQVPSIENLPCGQVFQDRPLVSDSSPVLGKNKNVDITVARPEGVTI